MGMNSYSKQIDRRLKDYDSLLFIRETNLGRYDVYRKSSTNSLLPHFVFALTDDWTPKGRPVEWGGDVVINRIKAHDIWRDDKFIDSIIQNHEKSEESKNRAFMNSVESFLYDLRPQFHKAFNGVNTANLEKVYPEKLKENKYASR